MGNVERPPRIDRGTVRFNDVVLVVQHGVQSKVMCRTANGVKRAGRDRCHEEGVVLFDVIDCGALR
ncbi:MAG TPA: hypothetical protein VGK04_10660 [Thermoanaerobaculia bacterium]